MTHTTEEFVRRELRSILRGDTYRNRFVCLPCLMSQARITTASCARVRPSWAQFGHNRSCYLISTDRIL